MIGRWPGENLHCCSFDEVYPPALPTYFDLVSPQTWSVCSSFSLALEREREREREREKERERKRRERNKGEERRREKKT